MANTVMKITSTSAFTDDEITAMTTTYNINKKPLYLLTTTDDIQSDLQPKIYNIYACFSESQRSRHPPPIFKSFKAKASNSILPEIDKLHDEITNNTNKVRIIKEFGNYNDWYEIAKDEIEKQSKLIVKIPASSIDNDESKKKKHSEKLRNLLKPSKEKNKIKQIKTMSNSLKEISVIYISSNDYEKQMNKIKELLNNKDESMDIVQYNGRGWMGAHHGNKICWLKDFVDYMDFNTFISFIDPYRREFSNDGVHFMNDYSLFIINSFIPFNKLFGTLISEEQRALLNRRIITRFDLDN